MRAVAVLLALPAACWPAGPPPAAKPTLAGEWRLLSTEDEKRPDAGSKRIRMVVAGGGKVRFLFAGEQTNAGTFIPAKGPGGLRAVDLRLPDGRVYRGVWALDGGRLVMCFAEEGQPRPAALRPGGGQWAERWQRVKPKGQRDR
jgi:uncharacterized protein (TIGR03067 family)